MVPWGTDKTVLVLAEAFLTDGTVLVVWTEYLGMESGAGPWRSGLYHPQTDKWTRLALPWNYRGEPPVELSVVGLADGSALAVLRDDALGVRTQSALFDPQQHAWLAPVDVPIDDLISARDAVPLSDGRLLMFGATASTYLYDPATASWAAGPELPFDGPSMLYVKVGHAIALLDDGTVLALSGDGHSARLPAGASAWVRAGRADVGGDASLAAFPGGAVALRGATWAGGANTHPDPRVALYNADTQRWSSGPAMDFPSYLGVASPGWNPAIVQLRDGRLLAAGGWGPGTDYACQEGAAILSTDAQTWQPINPMPACLRNGIGQVRDDGTVLIVGEGDNENGSGAVALSYLP